MKSFLNYVSGTGSSILGLLLLRYVIILLLRTNFGAQSTSIGQDVIWIVYGTCLVGCALAILSWGLSTGSKAWSTVMLGVVLLPTAVFALLHVSGKVGEYIKAE